MPVIHAKIINQKITATTVCLTVEAACTPESRDEVQRLLRERITSATWVPSLKDDIAEVVHEKLLESEREIAGLRQRLKFKDEENRRLQETIKMYGSLNQK